VDLSNFKPGDWLIVAGGAVMLVFGLALDWASFGSIKRNNAFDYFLTGGIAWLLVVGAGLAAFVLASGLVRRASGRWPLILVVATGVATALMLLRLILGAGEEPGVGNLDRSSGMYIAFLAAAVAFAGAISNFRAASAELRDDTDWSAGRRP
jgi:hypothetical protein